MLQSLRMMIQRGPGDDFLKERGIDSARTGKSRQNTAGTEEFEGQQVDILVATGRLLSLRNRRRKLGRIEDDQVKGAAFIAEFAQGDKNIRFAPFQTGTGQAV